MSVYISGVEIPKEHPLYITLRPDGSVHVWDSYSGGGYGTQAIHVPKHGDLKDADAVGDFLRNKYWNSPWVRSHILDKIVRDIKGFQTIIPADKEGEG